MAHGDRLKLLLVLNFIKVSQLELPRFHVIEVLCLNWRNNFLGEWLDFFINDLGRLRVWSERSLVHGALAKCTCYRHGFDMNYFWHSWQHAVV